MERSNGVRRYLKRVALVSAACAAVWVSASGASSAAPESTPEVGACYNLSKKQIDAWSWASGARSTDCGALHTAEVVSTPLIPESVAKFGRTSGDVLAWLLETCTDEVNEYAGLAPGTGTTTRTLTLFFLPTKSAWSAGEKTAVCATGSIKAKVNSKGGFTTAAARGSAQEVPGLPVYRIIDSSRYDLRYEGFPFKIGQTYPGEDLVKREANSFCAQAIGNQGYYFFYPLKADWQKGFRSITCWQRA